MSEFVRQDRGPVILPLIWLVCVLALAWHQWTFWRAPRLDADVFTLLPQDEQVPAAQRAMQQLAQQGERRIVVMVSGSDWLKTAAAAHRVADTLAQASSGMKPFSVSLSATQIMGFFSPWRDALLTDAQRVALRHPDMAVLSQQALVRLHGFGVGQGLDWVADPMGLWSSWWSERGGLTAARPRDGLLWVQDAESGRDWAVLLYETQGPAFRMDGDQRWAQAIASAERAVQSRSGDKVTLLAAGVPLHAEAGAAQGLREMNTIGWGSLAAVVVLVLVTFRAAMPMWMIALSLVVGCAAGASATALVFGQIHVLTMVFGASLVGVAEDFGIHYFASRQGDPTQGRWALMKHLMPGLMLALITSVLGYLILAVVPFPGLRQMALFSSVGLMAAFATVACVFPWLDRGEMRSSRFADWVAATLVRWPTLRAGSMPLFLMACLGVSAYGIHRLHTNDDLRQLQSSPPALMQAQIEVGRLLKMPSPAQFFLIQGQTEDEVLRVEEQVKQVIAAQADSAGHMLKGVGVSAVSDWVPSTERQAENRALTATAEQAVLLNMSNWTGESLRRPEFASSPLTLSRWLNSPVSEGARAQWLGKQPGGYTSVMLVRGLHSRAQAEALQGVAQSIPGVRWVDKAADIAQLMGRFRSVMTWMLLVGHVLVLAVLAVRFGRHAWRAWLPCALGSLLCVGLLGLLGESFQLFNLLALMLLLGMGVDYGIFLLEHPGESQGHAWLAVLLGAISTGLSFGLLALSATPALRAFGLTLLLGLCLVCALAPAMRLSNFTEQDKRGSGET